MTLKSKISPESVAPGTSRGAKTNRFIIAAVVLIAVAIPIVVVIWPMQASAFNQEGGLIETISAAGLFTAGLVALFRFPGISRLYIALVCLLLAERELEADIYSEGSLPFTILNALDVFLDMTFVRIVLAIVILGGIAFHGIPNGWRALKIRAPFLIVFVVTGTAAFAAQLLEEVPDMYGANLSITMATRLFVLEETLEMFFSIGILASVLIGWPKSQTEEAVDEPAI